MDSLNKSYYEPGMKFDLIIYGKCLTTYRIAASHYDKIGLSNKGKIFLVGDHHYVYEGRFVNSKCVDKITEKEFKILTKTSAGYFRKNIKKGAVMSTERKEVNRMKFSQTRYNAGIDISVFHDVGGWIEIEVTDNPNPKGTVRIPFDDLDWVLDCLQQAKLYMSEEEEKK